MTPSCATPRRTPSTGSSAPSESSTSPHWGSGAVIGTRIFVIIGEAIGQAGPSIIISFALAGVTCLFSAFSYAELASSIPISGP